MPLALPEIVATGAMLSGVAVAAVVGIGVGVELDGVGDGVGEGVGVAVGVGAGVTDGSEKTSTDAPCRFET